MKTRKIVVISITIVFLLIAILSCFSFFSVSKVEVDFSTLKNTDAVKVQSDLDEFIGKNLLFLETEEVNDSLAKYPYLEVLSVEKDYPNVIKVSLKERREVYYLENDGKVFILDQTGFVVNQIAPEQLTDVREKIEITLNNIEIQQLAVGNQLKTDNDNLISTAFKMANSVSLTDCIKSMSIDSKSALKNVNVTTYTGVQIWVTKAEENGVEKIKKAFLYYDQTVTDYQKAFDTLIVTTNRESGQIEVTWSDRSEIGE